MNRLRRVPLYTRITIWLIAVLLAATSFSFLSQFLPIIPAYGYETNTFRDFVSLPLGLENPKFDNGSGGALPAPSGWTETAYPNKEKGSTAMGVLNLDTYNTEDNFIESAKLTEYPEYAAAVPKTPFGVLVDATDTKRNILMINTTEATETAIGYQSNALALPANGYFRISAWAKTGTLYGIHGAAIRLNGIPDYNAVFNDIKTTQPDTELTKENLYGWKEYTFYIKTSSIRDENVTLALTIGDYYRGKNQTGKDIAINYTASGYVFFDSAEAFRISPTKYNYAFKSQTETDNVQFIDLSLPAADTNGVNLGIAPGADGFLEHYSIASAPDANVMTSDLARPELLDTDLTFRPDTNPYNLKDAPVPANGKYAGDGYILVLSSYQKGTGINASYKKTAVGYVSDAVTIEKFAFYRLSVWVKTHEISDGAGATIVVTTDAENHQTPGETFIFRATGSTGNEASEATYGWSEYAFYIRGSFYRDYSVTLGLWLGQEDNLSSGTAMFGNVRFEKLTGKQYAEQAASSAGGSPVDIDAAEAETGIVNGSFSAYGEPEEENKFPLPVSNWTFNTPSTLSASGLYSTDESFMNTDAIISGVMPTDKTHVLAHRDDYGTGAEFPNSGSGSVLYMASAELNAFSYTSDAFGLVDSATVAITVRMRVENVTGYGANLVLRDSNGILSTIERITGTNGKYHDFTFYVKNGVGDKTLALEIWLGLNERNLFNHNKLATGNLYVDTVSLRDIDAAEFESKAISYQTDLNLGTQDRDYTAYSYTSFNFTEYDPYDTNFIKFPYLWTISGPGQASVAGVRSGIFDSANIGENNRDIPAYFVNRDRRDENAVLTHNNVLILDNAIRTASTVTFDRPFTLAADTYYKLEVGLKVDIAKEVIEIGNSDQPVPNGAGATIALTGTDYKFQNIFDTATVIDQYRDTEDFKTFVFYLHTGEEELSVQLALSLGGEKPSQYTAGRLYVNSISFTDINNTLFDEETDKITLKTDNILKCDESKKIKAEETATDENDPLPVAPDGINWLIFPSVFFAAALLLALLVWILRRVFDNMSAKRAKRVATVATMQYARTTEPEKGYKDFAGTSDMDENRAYEAFDDTVTVSQTRPEKKQPERKVYTAPVEKEPVVKTIEADEIEKIDKEFIDAEPSATEKSKETEKSDIAPADEFVDSFDD